MPKGIFEKGEDFKPIQLKSLFTLVFLGACLFFLFYFYPPKNIAEKIKNEQNVALIKKTIEAVGKLMVLPTDEDPTVATVLDQEKLKDQSFFKNAQNGDVVLIYAKAGKAILYRQSARKIIEVGPIVFANQEGAQAQREGAKIKIAYYNGTSVAGLSRETLNKVANAYPDYETGVIGNASKKDYKETFVVDISGNRSREAGELAEFLGGKVSSLPAGETAPSADILIISGK